MKKLQILIPQYKETDDVVRPLLNSLAMQHNVSFEDFGVIICNDGSDVFLSESFLSSYPFKIDYYQEPHRGVSGTRNACMDYADAEYVMFCDADDMFVDLLGLRRIFNEIDTEPFDMMVSKFIEEKRITGTDSYLYFDHHNDSTFVHGKIYRLAYLREQNIRWNEELQIHEDSYFNIICQNMTGDYRYLDHTFYMWKWRDESVCRHDPKYMLKTYPNYLNSADKLIEEFGERRDRPDLAVSYIISTVFDAYYSMNKPEWLNQENQEYRKETEKCFAWFFNKYRRTWDDVPEEEKMEASEGARSHYAREGMGMEVITIGQWLGYIMTLVEEEN